MSEYWIVVQEPDGAIGNGDGKSHFGSAAGMTCDVEVGGVAKEHVEPLAHVFHADAGSLEHTA